MTCGMRYQRVLAVGLLLLGGDRRGRCNDFNELTEAFAAQGVWAMVVGGKAGRAESI
jgi:hypothetical protein